MVTSNRKEGGWVSTHIRRRKVLVGAWKHKRKDLYYNKCNSDHTWMNYILASTFGHLIFKGLERVEFIGNFPRWPTAYTTSVHIATSTHDRGGLVPARAGRQQNGCHIFQRRRFHGIFLLGHSPWGSPKQPRLHRELEAPDTAHPGSVIFLLWFLILFEFSLQAVLIE